MVQTSPSPLRVLDVAPYNQFTVTCTARVELNGETIPLEITIEWRRKFVLLSSSDPIYNIMTTGSPESGYQSILRTTETDTQNTVIYQCFAQLAVDSQTIGNSNTYLQIHGVYICRSILDERVLYPIIYYNTSIILQDQDSL